MKIVHNNTELSQFINIFALQPYKTIIWNKTFLASQLLKRHQTCAYVEY